MQSPARVRRIKIKAPDELEAKLREAGDPPRVPLESMTWHLVAPPPQRYTYRPHLRQGGSGGILGDALYLFGGFEDNGQRSNNLVQYSFTTHVWRTIECSGSVPSPRCGHACVIHAAKKELWLFGGQGPELGLNTKNLYDDLSILDLDAFVWRRAVVSCAGANGHVNFVPIARRGHSLVLHDNMLYIYGGSGLDRMLSKDAYFADLQRLDLATLCWYEPTMTGSSPGPRSHHSAIMLHGTSYMVVFGGQTATTLPSPERPRSDAAMDSESVPPDTGLANNLVYALDVRTCHWHVISPLDGTAPCARYGHVMQHHPINPLCIFLFGGKTHRGYDDGAIHCLDLELQRWSTLATVAPIPPRIRHVFSIFENQMMIFGGCGDNGLCIGDVFTVEMPILYKPKALRLFFEPDKVDDDASIAAPPSPRPHTIAGFMGFKSFQFTPARPELPRSMIRVSPIKVAKPPATAKPWTSVGL